MKAYELLFFVSPTLVEDEREATMTRVNDIISNQGGTIDNVDNWGRRKLAFEIDDLTDGDYTLLDFHAEPSTLSEISRVLRITDNVKRYMITARPDRD